MKRVIVIGLDGATWDVIKPWAEEGKLPTFKKLMQEGTWGELESTIPPMTGPAWVSFATGKNPGKHGFYNFMIRIPGKYETENLNAKDIKCKTLWEILSMARKKIVVLNVPVTYPIKNVNGIMVSGLLTPSIKSNFTHPPEFKRKIFNISPDYKIFVDERFSDNPLQKKVFLSKVNSLFSQRVRLFKYLFNNKQWDFLMILFNATDTIQHFFWKFMDKNHPLYNEKEDLKYKNAILNIYKKIDEFLNWLMKNIGYNTNLIIMSDHGFGSVFRNLYLNSWLKTKGYLSYKRNPVRIIKTILMKIGFSPSNIYRFMIKIRLGKKSPFAKSRKQKKIMSKVMKKIFLTTSDINWSKTKVFYTGSGLGYGFIHINLKGREPEGIVNEDEYEEIEENLISDLRELKFPHSDEKMIGNIWKREELFNGPYIKIAPDIIFQVEDLTIGTSMSFDFNSLRIIDKPITNTSGTHRVNGLFLAYGNDIKKNFVIKDVKIYDIMPTILTILKLPIREDFDGRVLSEIFQDSH